MRLDPEVLARVQFAFTVTFHIIFPTMSIGLAAFLVVIEGLWLKTKEPIYLQIYRFWMGIFAMGFGVGVVTGIVLSFEFGLGFAKFAQIAGPAIGPMIGLEVLTSFFLEAGFLGIMLFGLHRVGPKLHFFATCMVAFGTQLSASWIMSANSWMQTPDGITIQNGRVVVTNWLRVVDNPSWLVRLPHMLMAAFITGSFFVAGVGAWYLLRSKHETFGRRTVSLGIGFATVALACQLFIGDILYGTMLHYQPSKMQAAEGFWEENSPSPAPYNWIIVPDQARQRNRFTLGTPVLGGTKPAPCDSDFRWARHSDLHRCSLGSARRKSSLGCAPRASDYDRRSLLCGISSSDECHRRALRYPALHSSVAPVWLGNRGHRLGDLPGSCAVPPYSLGRLILYPQSDFSVDRSHDCHPGHPRLFGFRLQRVPR